MRHPRIIVALLAAALAAGMLAGLLVGPRIIDDDQAAGPEQAPRATIVDGPDRDTLRDDPIPLNDTAQKEFERAADLPDDRGELGGTLREPTDQQPAGKLEGPLAAQEFPGCRTRFVRNFSSRRGATPQIIVWHQTVSRDRPGVSDQDGLTALANSPSSGVSWHLLIGRTDGLCTFNVPLNMKAWTQGNANPFSFGIEVQAYGDEPRYVDPAGERKLLAVTRELGRRFNIPMRRGLVVNCQPRRSGIVEHSELGACGGGHADVTPWSTDALIIKAAAGLAPLTATDRRTCRRLNAYRRARDKGRVSPRRTQINVRRRKALEARGVRCDRTGPVRVG